VVASRVVARPAPASPVVASPVVASPVVASLTPRPEAAMGSSHILAVVTPYTIPVGIMDALQVTVLVLVAAGATAVVLIREPARQVIMLSVYGVLLAVLFLAFQAPDVTLSELTVGAVALPMLLLLALAKVRRREK
jgi:uncharacterized MnhB-related membrane protein